MVLFIIITLILLYKTFKDYNALLRKMHLKKQKIRETNIQKTYHMIHNYHENKLNYENLFGKEFL